MSDDLNSDTGFNPIVMDQISYNEDRFGPYSLDLQPQMLDMSALENVLGADAFRLSPATLANRVSNGDWIPARHLLYLSKIIAHRLTRGGARLIISLPPRHGKSELISHWTSIWCLDKYPHWELILASYGADLATDFGRKVRDTILMDADPLDGEGLLNCRINPNSTQVGRWHTTEGGGMRSVGVGGTMYGRGAHTLMIDDYFKNPEEAMSETHREKVFEWFTTIAMSRLAPGGNAIIIATRWHKDDLSGRLLRLPNSRWEEISIPVYAVDDGEDLLGRMPGEVLWPERYNDDAIMELKETMSSYFFSAIMMQDPKPSQSMSFDPKSVKMIAENHLPDVQFLKRVRSWDLAGTEDDGDWTVGTLVAKDVRNNNFYILDRERVRFKPGGVKALVHATAEHDGIQVRIVIEQEPGSAGKAVCEQYMTDLPEYSVHGVKHTGDKMVRLDPFFAAAEHGRVYMVVAPWNEEMKDELVEMPDGKFDDQADTLSQGYNDLFQKKSKAGTFGRTGLMKSVTGNMTSIAQSSGNIVTGVVFGR